MVEVWFGNFKMTPLPTEGHNSRNCKYLFSIKRNAVNACRIVEQKFDGPSQADTNIPGGYNYKLPFCAKTEKQGVISFRREGVRNAPGNGEIYRPPPQKNGGIFLTPSLTRLVLQCQTPLRSYPLSLIPTP